MASEMSAAIYDTMAVNIKANNYDFKANGQSLRFKGFMALYVESKDNEEKEEKKKKPAKKGKPLSKVKAKRAAAEKREAEEKKRKRDFYAKKRYGRNSSGNN